MLRNHLFLTLIVLLAAILRFYKLSEAPPSLYWDEAAIALDAKAIAQTGKDQHGNYFLQPIYPSWGDYKLPGYILVAMPFFKKFPNNPELAVRLPSALAGTLTVLLTFFLTKELFKFLISQYLNILISLTASFLLAVSPWHLQFSRAAFEANLALLFNVVAVFCFLKTQKRWIWLLPTIIFTTFGVYTYFSARIFLPMAFFLIWIFYSGKKPIGFLKLCLIFVFLWIFTSPLRNSPMAQQANQFRLSTQNILSNSEIIKYSSRLIEQDGGGFISRKIHHRYIYILKELTSHYFDHFSLNFLILSGDPNLRHSTGRIGVLLVVGFIGLIYGEYLLVAKNKKTFLFLNLLISTAFLPASVPYEVPHALRSLNAVVFLSIVSTFGLVYLIKLLKSKDKVILAAGCWLLAAGQLIFYLYDYNVHYPRRSALFWQKGYKEAIEVVDQEYSKAKRIIFTDSYARAYVYFLLYSSFPIKNFQQQRQEFLAKNPLDYSETFRIDKIEFRSINFENDSRIKKVLLVDSQDKPPFFKTWKNY